MAERVAIQCLKGCEIYRMIVGNNRYFKTDKHQNSALVVVFVLQIDCSL